MWNEDKSEIGSLKSEITLLDSWVPDSLDCEHRNCSRHGCHHRENCEFGSRRAESGVKRKSQTGNLKSPFGDDQYRCPVHGALFHILQGAIRVR
jgi:hypothetical protein